MEDKKLKLNKVKLSRGDYWGDGLYYIKSETGEADLHISDELGLNYQEYEAILIEYKATKQNQEQYFFKYKEGCENCIKYLETLMIEEINSNGDNVENNIIHAIDVRCVKDMDTNTKNEETKTEFEIVGVKNEIDLQIGNIKIYDNNVNLLVPILIDSHGLCDDYITIEKNNDDKLYISLAEAKALSNGLDKLIKETDRHLSDKFKYAKFKQVNILNGMFKGYEGKITDIDTQDKVKPLMVKVVQKPDFEGVVYLGYDEVEIISESEGK